MVNAFLQNGLKHGYIKPLLGKLYPLEEASQAHIDIMQNTGTCGRLTLTV